MSSNLDSILTEMILHQEKKVFEIARQIIPHITPEDVLNPQDFAQLEQNSQFNYEDGILSGLKSAQMAVRQSDTTC